MHNPEAENALRALLERVVAENRPHRWMDQLKQYNPYEDINGDYYRHNIRALHARELDDFGKTLIEDANYRSEAEKILANLLIDPEKSKLIPGESFLEGGIFGISYLFLLRRAFMEWQEAQTETAEGFRRDCAETFDNFIQNLSAAACLAGIRATMT
ncbi:MAG: hypothetical protein LBS10_07890 [Gracilibacteraceae bacterium]|nr:hypothetical protein [Gracilibacteraceae bacterium]